MVNTDRLCMGCMNDNGGEKICPICGYDSSEDNTAEQLAVGTWLSANRYLVGKVIGESGDGITYIAWDNDVNAVVNIKEYFPAGIAVRSADRTTVTPAEDRALTFTKGMTDFVDLFDKLSKQPEATAILRVTDTFESGGTVYAVQSTVSGTTLKAFLLRHGGTLKWEQIKPLFMPLLDTVSALNEAGIIHRGINPDNIIVGRDGKLRLTDFCIKDARVEHTEFLAQLPTGFAAPEQYLENDNYSASCDVYAMGAVIFRCLIGVTPPDAKERLMSDKLSIPAKITETVPRGVLVAVANTLKVDKTERVSSADRFHRMLEAVAANTVMLGDITPEEAPKKKEKKGGSGIKVVLISVFATIVVFVGLFFWLANHFGFMDQLFGSDSEETGNHNPTTSDSTSEKSEGVAPETKYHQEIPDLVGQKYSDAHQLMQTEPKHKKIELVVVGRMFSDEVAKGSICKQSIEAEKQVPDGTVLEVYVSHGPEKPTFPRIKGMSVGEAKAQLFAAGFYSDTIEFVEGIDTTGMSSAGEIYSVTYSIGGDPVSEGKAMSLNELITIYYHSASASTPDEDESSNTQTGTENSGTGDSEI